MATDSAPAIRPMVPASKKGGCLNCSLFLWCSEFEENEGAYLKNAEAIRKREKDGHTIRCRNVSEPWTKVDILFVNDIPSLEDDKTGLPANGGRTGALLRRTVEEFIDPSVSVGYTTAVRCRTPRNRAPNKTEVGACSEELWKEIEAREPKLIVCLGNEGMKIIAGQSGVTTLCGHFIDVKQDNVPDGMTVKAEKVLACVSPSYVLFMDHELGRFIEAIKQAGEYLKGNVTLKAGAGKYETITTLPMAKALLKKLAASQFVAIDTETGSLTPFQNQFPKLLCFSFSDEEGKGYVIPYDHSDSPWARGRNDRERIALTHSLREFFLCPNVKIGQNEKFDRQHIREALGVEPVNVIDTMLMHLTMNDQKGTHGLKDLAMLYTGMGDYERPLEDYKKAHSECDPKNEGGSYANIPGDVLFPYAGMDADVTLRVFNAFLEENEFKDNPQFQNLAFEFFPRLSRVLADIEYEGAFIDLGLANKLEERYRLDLADREAAIREIPEVKQLVALLQSEWDQKNPNAKKRKIIEFNPGSTTQLRRLLFDVYGLRPVELTDTGFERLVDRWKSRKSKSKKKIEFQEIVDEAITNREWEHFSTDADALQEYKRSGNKFVESVLEYRGPSVLYGTFIEPTAKRLDAKSRVHGSFNIHGTKTGRLSSSSPNLQNIPNKGDGSIKKMYASRFGNEGVILQLDYSQIELRVAAAYFNEPTMLQAYRDGADLHMLTAIVISGHTPEEYKNLSKSEKKKWRTRAKRVNFGVVYGGGAPALQSTLKKDGVFLTREECQKMIDDFFEARPALKEGIENLKQTVSAQGYLDSFTGRRSRAPMVFSDDRELVARAHRQSVNFPIQSGAADMTLMALILIHDEMEKRKYKSKLVLTVHDSIIVDCHVDEVLEIAVLAKEIMETLPQRSAEVLPGLDWSWLSCPIVAECELGTTWGTGVEFDPNKVLSGKVPTTPLSYLDEEKKTQYRSPETVDELWELMELKAA